MSGGTARPIGPCPGLHLPPRLPWRSEPAPATGNSWRSGPRPSRWIFPEFTDRGLNPWTGVRWVAVAGSAQPTHAVDATAVFERAVRSLLEHRTCLEALAIEAPETYARSFITGHTEAASKRFGGAPAVAFEVFNR